MADWSVAAVHPSCKKMVIDVTHVLVDKLAIAII